MASSIRVTPLYGAHTSAPPLCTVLEIDDGVFLLDCGWNDRFDVALLEPLRPVITRGIDAVFLTHPDLAHLGALPYLVGKLGLPASVPIYATTPVQILGQMFLYDAHQHRYYGEDFETFTLDDVDEAFERMRPVKYQQVIELAQNVFATAYPAGHLLGGAIWKFQKESEEIVYCVDVNHRRERLLNGCASTPQLITKPSHLIVGASGVLTAPSQKKETDLWEAVVETLRGGGDVLMPVDSAGRCLELLVAADEFWTAHPDVAALYPVVFAQHVGIHTIEFAKSLIEWMSDAVVSAFDSRRENPFRLRHVQVVHGLDQAHALPSPKVVMAPLPSLDYGFSRVLFLQRIAADPRAMVLMSDRLESGTFAFRLAVEKEKLRVREPLTYAERVPLQGEELERWQREQEKARFVGAEVALESAEMPMVAPTAVAEKLRGGRVVSSGPLGEALVAGDAAQLHEALGPDFPGVAEDEEEHDVNQRYQALVQAGLLLPHVEPEPPPHDAYGEVIDPARYMIGEDPGDRTIDGDAFEGLAKSADNAFSRHAPDQGEPMDLEPHKTDNIDGFHDERMATVPSPSVSPSVRPERTSADAPGSYHRRDRFRSSAHDNDAAVADSTTSRALETLPTKLVRYVVNDLTIRCAVRNFDMAGLADGRSLRQLIVSMAPQRVIIIHGSERETAALTEYLGKKNFTRLYAPRAREMVDVSSDTSVYRIKLDDSLLRRCFWRRMQDYELAWFDGYIQTDPDGQLRLVSVERQTEQEQQLPEGTESGVDAAWLAAKTTDAASAATALVDGDRTANTTTFALVTERTQVGHRNVFVGDLRLSDLKEIMTKSLMPAEFAGGALCVENDRPPSIVLVRKRQHDLVIEGSLSAEYFDVRDLVYSQYMIL